MRKLCPISCDSLTLSFTWNKASIARNSLLGFCKIFLWKSLLQFWITSASELLPFALSLAWIEKGWWVAILLGRTPSTSTEIAPRLVSERHAARQCLLAYLVGCMFAGSSFKGDYLAQYTHLQKRKCLMDSHSDRHYIHFLTCPIQWFQRSLLKLIVHIESSRSHPLLYSFWPKVYAIKFLGLKKLFLKCMTPWR